MYKAVLDASALHILLDNSPGINAVRAVASEAVISDLSLAQVVLDLKAYFPLDEGLVNRIRLLTKDVLICKDFTVNALLTNANAHIDNLESLAAIALARQFKVPLYTDKIELSEQNIPDVEIKYIGSI